MFVFDLVCAVFSIWSFSFTFQEGQNHKEGLEYSENVPMVK